MAGIFGAVSELEYDALNGEIKRAMRRSARDMIQLGYMLKLMLEKKMWAEHYLSFDEYLEAELQMDYTMATRFIKANKKYSALGGSMEIDEKYEKYSQSVLIEMLNMPEELEEKITPDMTARQVRKVKRQEKQKNVKIKPGIRGLMDDPYCRECGIDLDEKKQPGKCPECGQALDWTGWQGDLTGHPEEEVPSIGETIDGEFREIDSQEQETATEEVATSQPDMVHDEEWFVRQYVKLMPDEAAELLEICKGRKNNSDRAKAVKEHIAPYGHHYNGCSEYSFTFGSLNAGIDIQIGDEKIHLKYIDFAKALTLIADAQEVATSQPEISAYGLEKTEYEEGSLLTTVGCGHKYNCFSCAQDCAIRQESRYCRMAPMGNPFGCTTMEVLEMLKEEVGDRCQFVNGDLAYRTAGSGEADPCCRDCKEPCGYRCRKSVQEDAVFDTDPMNNEPENTISDTDSADNEPENMVYDTDFVEKRDGLREIRKILDQEKKLLADYLSVGGLPEWTVFRQKTIVGALAAMVCDLEDEAEEAEQPELPAMTNDATRRAFIESYTQWPVWIDTKETGERYYRYQFRNGTSFVVKAYLHKGFDYRSEAEKWEDRFHEVYGDEEYYVLVEGKYFRDCRSSKTMMIEALKDLQKKGK